MTLSEKLRIVESCFPEIRERTYDRCRNFEKFLNKELLPSLWIVPNDFDGIDMRFEKKGGEAVVSFGDDCFSYYILKNGAAQPEFFDFIKYKDENLRILNDRLTRL